MAKLTEDQVKRVAQLAKLDLTSAEITTFGNQLSEVIDYVDQLGQVDTLNSDPTNQTTGLTNVFREDEIDPMRTLSPESALSNASQKHNDYFMVDLILKNKNE
jgi:aspartyl-tRNA(Asn)/glutamyl-tRNA(Gln) amidotransferase subunit C